MEVGKVGKALLGGRNPSHKPPSLRKKNVSHEIFQLSYVVLLESWRTLSGSPVQQRPISFDIHVTSRLCAMSYVGPTKDRTSWRGLSIRVLSVGGIVSSAGQAP